MSKVASITLNNGEQIPQLGFGVFDFELSTEDSTAIGALGIGEQIGPDPDRMG